MNGPTIKKDVTEGLFPKVKLAALEVLEKLEKLGIQAAIHSGYRSFEDQDALYSLGRTTRNPDGASPAKPMGNIVTNSRGGESWHNYSIAVDIVRLKDGHFTWELPFQEIGRIGKECGFEWGGDWENFKDLPHLQMRFGLNKSEALRITKLQGLPALWESISKRWGI